MPVRKTRWAAGVALVLAVMVPRISAADQSPALPPLASLYSEANAAKLLREGRISRIGDDGNCLFLPSVANPGGSGGSGRREDPAAAIGATVLAEKPSLLVEAAFLLPRKAPESPAAARSELAKAFAILSSFSTLQGLQYWSASRNTMRTFYAESWRVDPQAPGSPLPDPAPPRAEALPSSAVFIVHQKDLTFGSHLYKFTIETGALSIRLDIGNEDRIWYGPIPILDKGGLASRLLILQAREGLLFYIETNASAPGILRAKIGESFSNRAVALYGWFKERWEKGAGG